MKYFLGLVLGTFAGVLWAKAWGWEWWGPMVMLAALWLAAAAGFTLAALMAANKRAEEISMVRRLYHGPRRVA